MIKQGHEFFLYINEGTSEVPSWKPVGYAQTHEMSKTAQTRERSHKNLENPLYPEQVVTRIDAEITCDGLINIDASNTADVLFDRLNEIMSAGSAIMCKYSEDAEGVSYEQGSFIMTSLKRSDKTGEDSTFSLTLKSSGALETVEPAE